MNRKRKTKNGKIEGKRKLLTGILAGILVLGLTGCGKASDSEAKVSGAADKAKTAVNVTYDGSTTIKTPWGNWKPPKGSRRLADGSIVDAQGCVIGNDGTVRISDKAVG